MLALLAPPAAAMINTSRWMSWRKAAPAESAATAADLVERWRAARRRLGERFGAEAERCGVWEWAATREGAARLRTALCAGRGDALERFIRPPPPD